MDGNLRQARRLLQLGAVREDDLRRAQSVLDSESTGDLCAVMVRRGVLDPRVAERVRFEVSREAEAAGREPRGASDRAGRVTESVVSGDDLSTRRLAGGRASSGRLDPPAPVSDVEARYRVREAYRRVQDKDPLFSPHADVVLERIEDLGQGGMGVVSRVRDVRLGREAALKLLRADVRDEESIGRFLREARITARLDHPGIPPIYEAGRTAEGRHYLLMKVIEGQTFKRRIDDWHEAGRPKDRLPELIEILLRAAEAVGYANARGIIHRDLKPANIMVGKFNEVMVLDWGMSRDRAESDDSDLLSAGAIELDTRRVQEENLARNLTQKGFVLGTPGYMAPEQARGEDVDEQADVFGLGACLVELLSGQAPVLGDTAEDRIIAVLKGEIAAPGERLGDVPPELDSLARAATAFDRAKRIGTAEGLVVELRAWLSGEPLAVHTYSALDRLGDFASRRPGTLLMGVAGSLLVGLALLWSAERRRSAEARLEAEKARLDRLEAKSARRALEDSRSAFEEAGRRLARAHEMVAGGAEPAKIKACVEDALALVDRRPAFLRAAVEVYLAADLDEAARALLEDVPIASGEGEGLIAVWLRLHERELDAAVLGSVRPPAELHRELMASTKSLATLIKRLEAEQEQTGTMPEAGRGAAALEALRQVVAGGDSRRALAAVEESRAALEARPGLWLGLKACCALDAGEAEAGRAALEEALRLEPGNRRLRLLLAAALREAGELERALVQLSELLRLEPRRAALWWRRAKLRRESSRVLAAVSDAKEALALDPGCRPAAIELARCYTILKFPDQAIEAYDRALQVPADDPELYYDRGRLLDECGRFEEALADQTRAIALEPKFVGAYQSRGVALYKLGRFDEAAKDFEVVIAQKETPRSLDWKNLGGALLQAGQWQRALDVLQKCLDGNTRTPVLVRHYRAKALYALKRSNEALNELDEALKLEPGHRDSLILGARIYLQAKRVKSAEALLTRVIESGRPLAVDYINRVKVRLRLGRYAESLEDARKALRCDNQSLEAAYYIGLSQERLGRREQAADAYSRALAGARKAGNKPWIQELEKRLGAIKSGASEGGRPELELPESGAASPEDDAAPGD